MYFCNVNAQVKQVKVWKTARNIRNQFIGKDPVWPPVAKSSSIEDLVPFKGKLLRLHSDFVRSRWQWESLDCTPEWFQSSHLPHNLTAFSRENFTLRFKPTSGISTDRPISRTLIRRFGCTTTFKLGVQWRPRVHHRVQAMAKRHWFVNCKFNGMGPCDKGFFSSSIINDVMKWEKDSKGLSS